MNPPRAEWNEWRGDVVGLSPRVYSKHNEAIDISIRALLIFIFAQHLHGTNIVPIINTPFNNPINTIRSIPLS